MRVLTRAVGVLGELLMTTGALLLLFVAWQLWWTDVTTGIEQDRLTQGLYQEWEADGREPVRAQAPAPAEPAAPGKPQGDPPAVEPASTGEAFAFLHVPRFGESYRPRGVLEGTDEDTLETGVGHYSDSALPGAVGNFAVAGHRVTYGRPFNQIHELRKGDAVVVETKDTWYTYRVTEHLIVAPEQVDVVAPTPGKEGVAPTERMLTMTACHPMFSARQRYIVHAVLESWQPVSAGEPASLALGAG